MSQDIDLRISFYILTPGGKKEIRIKIPPPLREVRLSVLENLDRILSTNLATETVQNQNVRNGHDTARRTLGHNKTPIEK